MHEQGTVFTYLSFMYGDTDMPALLSFCLCVCVWNTNSFWWAWWWQSSILTIPHFLCYDNTTLTYLSYKPPGTNNLCPYLLSFFVCDDDNMLCLLPFLVYGDTHMPSLPPVSLCRHPTFSFLLSSLPLCVVIVACQQAIFLFLLVGVLPTCNF